MLEKFSISLPAKLKKQAFIPIVLDSGINALGVARSLGGAGLFTIALDSTRGLVFSCKYAYGLICPDPDRNEERFVDFLVYLRERVSKPCVLIPTSDRYVIALGKNEVVLKERYILTQAKWEIVSRLINKRDLYRFAADAGIACPRTVELSCISELDNPQLNIPAPGILKPTITVGFEKEIGKKVLFYNSIHELDAYKSRLLKSTFHNSPMVVQEYIPGGVENLITITSYANTKNEITAFSIGHKIRQNPPFSGSIICGRIHHIPEILSLGREFIRKSSFSGISNIEFKYDVSKKEFKLIEINPRTGVWNYSAYASGINIPLAAMCDLTNYQTYHEQTGHGEELVWINSLLDLYKSLYGFRKAGYVEKSMSFRQWLRSVNGKKVDAVFNLKDPIPGICYIIESLRSIGSI